MDYVVFKKELMKKSVLIKKTKTDKTPRPAINLITHDKIDRPYWKYWVSGKYVLEYLSNVKKMAEEMASPENKEQIDQWLKIRNKEKEKKDKTDPRWKNWIKYPSKLKTKSNGRDVLF